MLLKLIYICPFVKVTEEKYSFVFVDLIAKLTTGWSKHTKAI